MSYLKNSTIGNIMKLDTLLSMITMKCNGRNGTVKILLYTYMKFLQHKHCIYFMFIY